MCYKHGATLQACFVNFGMAAQNGGRCILRFDDTNPDAEKQEFIDHIQDIISWLGWTPAQVWT
jgi:glutaminyl-tRNA synthetase